MTRNWAIAIGINDYNSNNFTPLRYAKQDAEAVRDFFNQAGFDQVCFFTDDSPRLTLPNGATTSTYPSCGNLRSFLQDRFETPFLSKGDNCWFFFAGHGQQYQNRDYLMPIDAPNPRGREPEFAIPVSYVRERLSRAGADNVILLLDACRNQGSRDSNRPEWEPQQGIITISACSPLQKSWEIEHLQHQGQEHPGAGAFTYALLEALRIPGERNCATVERLDNYLRHRVPQLCRDYDKRPEQLPRVVADPAEKFHFILLPSYATLADTAALKNDAYRLAFVENNLSLAEQVCIRANAAARGTDTEVLRLYARIQQLQERYPDSAASAQPRSPEQVTGSGNAMTHPTASSTEQQYREPPKAEPDPPPPPEDDLGSEKGIDYTRLRDLLKAGKWKKADQETNRTMLQAVGRKAGDWIRAEELRNFPCTDLRTIDALWVKYSQGKWGFSVQKRIWEECGSPIDDDWEKFGDRVGWRKGGKWLSGHELTYDLDKSFNGELPVFCFRLVEVRNWIRMSGDRVWRCPFVVCLFSRTKVCRL